MASILYDNLESSETSTETSSTSTYVDIKFDIEIDTNINGNYSSTDNALLDVKINEDVYAITGSIVNILNTRKGQRYLIPNFGSSILSYLFTPISAHGAQKIGNDIKYSIETWEPRVTVKVIEVIPYPETGTYVINIRLYAPTLNKDIQVVGGLSQSTGIFEVRG